MIGRVRPIVAEDTDALVEMRRALWTDGSRAEHRFDVEAFLRGERPRGPQEVLIAETRDGRILGFAEVAIRPYAEGCRSHRVGYLEGWYVVVDARRRGVGRALVDAAERWSRQQGCDELASDAHPENRVSFDAHRAVGFEDAGLVRCFRKDLHGGRPSS